MKIVKSEQYGELGNQAEKVLDKFGEALSNKEKELLRVFNERAKTLRMVESATGLKFDVFESGKSGVAAFITTAGKETHIAAETLDNREWALHAARHEKMHFDTASFFELDVEAFLKEDQFKVLQTFLKKLNIELDKRSLVEGFTDLLTARQSSKNENSAYNQREVPAAERLENLCLDMTGESLVEAFRANNLSLFMERLERLSARLVAKEIFESLKLAA